MQSYSKHTFYFTMLAFMLISTFPVLAQTDEEPLFLFRGARPLGLGNAYEAISDDIYAIHYNPAGLAQIDERKWQILILRGRATQDLVGETETLNDFINDTIDPLTDSDNPLTSTDPLLIAARERLVDRAEKVLEEDLGLDLGLPSFGVVEPLTIGGYKAALGLSFYTQTSAKTFIVETGLPWNDKVMEMLDNPVFYRVTVQGSLATALSVEIPIDKPFLQAVNVGGGFRLIRRGTFTDAENPFSIQDILDTDEFKRRYFDLEDDAGFAEFARDNVDSKTGYSVDFGTMLFPVAGLRIALAWRNVVSNMPVEYEDAAGNEIKENREFPSNFVVAAAVKPLELTGTESESLDLTLTASWDDPNGDDRLGEFELDSSTDHIHLGAEAVFWPKSLFSLGIRAGNNQGFATYGATLRLFKFLNFNAGRYSNVEADWWFASTELSF